MNRLIKSAASLALVTFAFGFVSCDDDDVKVLGLNKAAQYGNIKVTFEGTRPDGEPFEASKNFKYMAEDGPYSSEVEFDDLLEFNVTRWYGAVDDYSNYNYADLELEVNNGDVEDTEFYVTTSIISTSDNTFFYIDDYFYPTGDDITDYSFNEDTGKLKYKFTTTSSENSTGSDLTITVEVDVTVFENIGQQPE
jgi:hypothetical protein